MDKAIWKKAVALVLGMILLVESIPGLGEAAERLAPIAEESARIVREMEEVSTETSTTYEMSDGTQQHIIQTAPIRYRDARTGELVEIDNSLEKQGKSGLYKNAAGIGELLIAERLQQTGEMPIEYRYKADVSGYEAAVRKYEYGHYFATEEDIASGLTYTIYDDKMEPVQAITLENIRKLEAQRAVHVCRGECNHCIGKWGGSNRVGKLYVYL